jgi:beta-lactamase regulating signal transducer with metallopeptidase domain
MTNAMNWLVSTGLMNAAAATLLASVAWVVGRCWRRPALAHLLWAIVLLKLLTPTLVEIPVGWKLDLSWAGPRSPVVASVANESREQPTIVEPAGPSFPQVATNVKRPDETVDRINISQPRLISEQTQVGQAVSAAVQSQTASHRSSLDSRVQATTVALVNWLPVIWLGGIVVSLLMVVRRAWAFHAFIGRAGFADPSLSRRLAQLAQAAALPAAPSLTVVRGIVSPMLWGIAGRVQLIFPARLAAELSPAARDALLLHELAHYRRGDQWVRLIELAAQVLYWWHPVVWWARSEIESAEEQCCDAWVVERQSGSRRTYAEALLATIDFLCDQPTMLPPAASGLGDVPLLRIRLTQIMRGNLAASLSAGAKTAVLTVAALILPLGPGLFGASDPPRTMRQAAATTPPVPDAPIDPKSAAGVPPSSSVDSSTLATTGGTETLPAAVNLQEVFRPASVVTAAAVSRNGKYRLERRKGSHVTLVNQATDWRLDMSAHGILCVAFTPDSRLFVTGHDDSLVRVWESETGGLAMTLKGSSDAVWSIAVAAAGAEIYHVAAGARDGSVLVWDLASGDELARLPPTESSVSCLRWSSQGERLAISFGDFSARDQDELLVWSVLDNVRLSRVTLDKPIAALAWLPGDGGLVIADWRGETQVWRMGDESPRYSVLLGKEGKQAVEAAHWSADCPLIPARPAEDLVAVGK